MWAKFSNAMKSRSEMTSPIPEEETNTATGEVLSRVKELHPNMSVFNQDDTEVPFPTPSPPASPTLSRRGMLKRLSKLPHNDSTDALPKPGIVKKVKSSLANINTGSDQSLSRASGEIYNRQPTDAARPSLESVRTPVTPIADKNGESRFGSLRSILKPNNTPGTGQSVRFFSRDAYRVLTPEQSSASELEDTSLMNRVPRISSSSRPSLQNVFTAPPPPPPKDSSPLPPDMDSMILPALPPNTSNLFDMSSMDMPTIPVGFSAPLLDSAVEIETDDQLSVSLDGSLGSIESQAKSEPSEGGSVVGSPTVKLGPALHDRSQSFSFGQTIFRSMAGAESSPAVKTQSAQRSRAMSDTVFASMLSSPLAVVAETKGYKRPEADINDPSQAIVAYQAPPPPPPNEKERDPFAANATTYYVPGMMLPPSPPQSQHTRTASREEDIIWSLRTQVALQSELCSQYEVDLSAKDEMLQALTSRLTDSEKELERRKTIIRNWRKRVGELEKCVRGLEEEVDRSREVSMDRSVMDEASGEALRMLHRQISQLEKEKKESDQREKDLKARFESTAAQLAKAQEEIRRRDQSESELKAGIKAAKDEMELMGELGKEQAQDERDRRQSAQAWEEERSALKAANDSLRDDHLTTQAVITGLREEIVTKENELGVLKAELEAQWKHTEHSTEEMEKLKQERDALAREADELREKLASVEADWDDNDQRKQELEHEIQDAWAAREEIEQERAELERQLRSEQDHAEELTRALQEREDRVSILEQERQYAHDNVARLQESLRQRDAEISTYEQRIREREAEVEEVRESLTKQKREHARIVDEQSRRISEVVAREVEARAHMENMVKGKAENDVNASTLKERVNALKDEVERLRRQVHELQQESADKDMKLVQSAKQRAQDKEDMQGLNIALDSKQQELELLKRRLGTRTSAGSTPASKAPLRRESSASGVFSTPSAVRPPSALSDASSTTKERKSDPASTTKSSLARSVRPNGSVVNSARSSLAPSASKGRISLAPAISTPARNGSALARSSSVTPMPPPKHRRVSSSVESLRAKGLVSTRESPSASSASEQEKENIETTPVVRSGRIPVPA